MADDDQHFVRSTVPVPDPTVLTTAALYREVSALKELLSVQQIALRQEIYDKLDVREELRIEQKKDTEKSLEAALTAAKEAVKEQTVSGDRAIAKSEAAVDKRIDLQAVLIDSIRKNLEDKISDSKDRLTVIEARFQGAGQFWGVLLGAVGMIGGIILVLLAFLHKAGP